MKHLLLSALCGALLFAFSGCTTVVEVPSSGGSIAPSGSSGGSIGASR